MSEPLTSAAAINMTTVQVSFDPATSSLSTDIPPTGISVPQGISMIVLQLSTSDAGPTSPQAVFQTVPIQWFDFANPTLPTRQADTYLVQRVSDFQFTIVVFNSAPVPVSHRFNIVVAYDGKTFGADPVIINEPPAPE